MGYAGWFLARLEQNRDCLYMGEFLKGVSARFEMLITLDGHPNILGVCKRYLDST